MMKTMPAERYFFPQLIENDQLIFLDGGEHHHLIHVMRTKLGEEIEVVNGMGQLAAAVVESIEKKTVSIRIKTIHTEMLNTQKIILAQGMPKFSKLEFIIEKGTELGMTEIWLFPASRSEKKDLSENQHERLNTLMIAAMKQCGRLFLPKIIIMPPIKQWNSVETQTVFFGDVNPQAKPFISLLKELKPEKDAVFCIGPESGFTDQEIEHLKVLGAHGVKLNQNILRTETAAIAAVALMNHYFTY